jgi:polo-like kinase 1
MRVAMDEMKCRTIICDVYQGLLYLAENAIVHRDVKVANVFVRDGVAKIADFGFARKARYAML